MKLERAVKNLDADTIKELESADAEALKKRVLEANQAMQQVENELAANQEYQELLENKKAMEAGKKEVNKRQNSIITVALAHLEALSVL